MSSIVYVMSAGTFRSDLESSANEKKLQKPIAGAVPQPHVLNLQWFV